MNKVKIGQYEAEALTAMVVTKYGSLILTRVMPGQWIIQTPGSPDEDFTPTWDGERFRSPQANTIDEGRLEDAITAASLHLMAAKEAAKAVSTSD